MRWHNIGPAVLSFKHVSKKCYEQNLLLQTWYTPTLLTDLTPQPTPRSCTCVITLPSSDFFALNQHPGAACGTVPSGDCSQRRGWVTVQQGWTLCPAWSQNIAPASFAHPCEPSHHTPTRAGGCAVKTVVWGAVTQPSHHLWSLELKKHMKNNSEV